MSYKVRNYNVGDPDKNGVIIDRVFHKYAIHNDSLEFIIYQTEDKKLGFEGKTLYNDRLGNYEIEIGNIINAIEIIEAKEEKGNITNQKHSKEVRKRYNDQFAAVIKEAISTDNVEQVKKLFAKLMAKINNHTFSSVKSEYLERCMRLTAVGVGIALFLWFWQSGLTPIFKMSKTLHPFFVQMIYIGMAGMIGGFISVKIKIEDLKINPHLPYQRTMLDANIRMFLSFFFAILFFWFLKSGFFTLINKELLVFGEEDGTLLCLLLGVIGGFSERIVPSMLQAKEEEYVKKIIPPAIPDKGAKPDPNPLNPDPEEKQKETKPLPTKNTKKDDNNDNSQKSKKASNDTNR